MGIRSFFFRKFESLLALQVQNGYIGKYGQMIFCVCTVTVPIPSFVLTCWLR
jgi:hypothetical protein